MKRRWATKFWIPVGMLATLFLWLGCGQKGDISPMASGRKFLTFIDSVSVNPLVVSPRGHAVIETRVLNEAYEPASGEDVRFTVTRGAICITHSDTTVQSDGLGVAHATFTAPPDTGAVFLRIELRSMGEVHHSTITVTNAP
jgi:hypothetical protein